MYNGIANNKKLNMKTFYMRIDTEQIFALYVHIFYYKTHLILDEIYAIIKYKFIIKIIGKMF